MVLKIEYNRIYNGKLLHVQGRQSKRASVATGRVLLGINGILQGPFPSVALRFLRVLLGEAIYSPPGIFYGPSLPLPM